MPFINQTSQSWTDLLNVTNYDFYHLPGWAELDAELLEGKALAWYYEGEEGRCLIPLIERWFGDERDLVSPYGYPGILYEETIGWKQALKVINAFNDEAAKEGYVSSFIRLNPFLNDWCYEEGDVVIADTDTSSVRQVFYGNTVYILLDSYNGTSDFSTNHRRNITRLHEDGFYTKINDWSLLPGFIEAYHQTMKRRKASAYYYFQEIYFSKLRSVLGDHLTFIAVLSKDGELMSGGLFTDYNSLMQYHLGGTIDIAVRHSTSKLMIEAAVQIGLDHQVKVLRPGWRTGWLS